MPTDTPAVLLWDFGDTLVDERWMRRPPPECPTWEEVWVDVMADHADDWDIGRIGAEDIYRLVADRSGMTTTKVRTHARRCCESIVVNETAWRVAAERRRPQALVTVNPDLFTDLVVPAYGLDAVFDVIVVSCAEGTVDKPALCDIARERLGHTGPRSEALLIDNRLDQIQAWRSRGGAAYHFEGDRRFAADLAEISRAW